MHLLELIGKEALFDNKYFPVFVHLCISPRQAQAAHVGRLNPVWASLAEVGLTREARRCGINEQGGALSGRPNIGKVTK